MSECRLCGGTSSKIIYDGPIRDGNESSGQTLGYSIHECERCTFTFLSPLPEELSHFYESGNYRNAFHGGISIDSMRSRYDVEQNERLRRIGIERMRGKVVADFGSGPGLFLDPVSGVAKEVIAVEPESGYKRHHKSLGRRTVSYAEELKGEDVAIDIAVSFDVIEHVPNFTAFAQEIHDLLVEDGLLFLSMPNLNDLLRMVIPKIYNPFFFQTSHLNYFSEKTGLMLLEQAGFVQISVEYIHKYDIRNLLQWTLNRGPGILNIENVFDRISSEQYQRDVERLGYASHLFFVARKKSL